MRALLALLLACLCLPAQAQDLVVSAAASLRDVMGDVAASFERETGHAVGLNLASSGQLAAQVQNGAEVDVFISAADEQVDALQRADLLLEGTRRVVVGNELVLIVPIDASNPPTSLADLAGEDVRRIAIGQPRTVPAGDYAAQALGSLKLLERLNDRLVYASNVRHVLAYVAQGDVDAGLVYRTDALREPTRVRIVATVDPALHRPIRYTGVVVAASDHPDLARRFLDYLGGPSARETFRRYGFADAPAPHHPSGPAMSDALWPSLVMSVRIAVLATILCALIGIPLAFAMAKLRFAGKSLVETLITLPLILPPTVVGYVILMAAGNQSPIGSWLRDAFDYSLLFNVHGAILASAIVALPLLYMPTRAAFTAVDRELEDASRQMGANVLQMFWHVSLPLARRGLASGLLLAFARALGEFGATAMVFGTGPGARPLPIRIYLDYESGDLALATGAVVALTAASLVIMFVYNRSSLARQE